MPVELQVPLTPIAGNNTTPDIAAHVTPPDIAIVMDTR